MITLHLIESKECIPSSPTLTFDKHFIYRIQLCTDFGEFLIEIVPLNLGVTK